MLFWSHFYSVKLSMSVTRNDLVRLWPNHTQDFFSFSELNTRKYCGMNPNERTYSNTAITIMNLNLKLIEIRKPKFNSASLSTMKLIWLNSSSCDYGVSMQYNGILRNICSNGNIQVDLQNNEINLNDEKNRIYSLIKAQLIYHEVYWPTFLIDSSQIVKAMRIKQNYRMNLGIAKY